MNTRRAALVRAGSALAAALLAPSLRAQPAVLPRAVSLQAELARALAGRKALVVMVSLEGCPYCKLVRESYLLPLRAQGQPVVQVDMAVQLPLVDAKGSASTHAQVVRALGVRVAPTVLFLGLGGVEAAPPLVGVGSVDFYGAYLAERVSAANRSVAG